MEKKMTKKDIKAQEVENAKNFILEVLGSNRKVYTDLLHVSSSGMTREIKVIVIKDERPVNISWAVAKVLDWKLGNRDGVKVSGCGMDMGFHLVYSLSSSLFRGQERAGYILNQNWL